MLPFQLIATDVATQQGLQQVYMSEHGILYQADCLKLLSALPDESVDLVFADPPFNLGKEYGEGVSDRMEGNKYFGWSKQWLGESIRVLKPGGSLFVFKSLPLYQRITQKTIASSKRERKMTQEIRVQASSGNVFADLGLENSDELLVQLALQLVQLVPLPAVAL